MSGGPELFVVCRSCGSEVSPYVTECPYCGTRIRKRAPKLDQPPKPPRGARIPRLSPIRPGEIPGVAAGPLGRPYATIMIVALSLLGFLLFEIAVDPLWTASGDYQRLAYAPFIYLNGWYQLAILLPIGLFGWLLEARHGPLVVIVLFALCGFGAAAVAVAAGDGLGQAGAPGAALGMLAAWAVPDLRRMRRGEDYEGDLLGALALAVVVLLMPALVTEASLVATVTGGLAGLLVGVVLAGGGR